MKQTRALRRLEDHARARAIDLAEKLGEKESAAHFGELEVAIKQIEVLRKVLSPNPPVTAAIGISILALLFSFALYSTRLPTTEVEVTTVTNEVQIIPSQDENLLTEIGVLALTVDAGGLRRIDTPDTPGSNVCEAGGVTIFKNEGSIVLNQFPVNAGAKLRIHAGHDREIKLEMYRPDVPVSKWAPLAVGLTGPVSIAVHNKVNCANEPSPLKEQETSIINLQLENNPELSFTPDQSTVCLICDPFPISSISFQESTRGLSSKRKQQKRLPKVMSGTVEVVDTGRVYRLKPNDVLEITPVHGQIRSLKHTSQGLFELAYHGTASNLRLGSSVDPHNVMPSCLEYLIAQLAIRKAWLLTSAVFTILMACLRMVVKGVLP